MAKFGRCAHGPPSRGHDRQLDAAAQLRRGLLGSPPAGPMMTADENDDDELVDFSDFLSQPTPGTEDPAAAAAQLQQQPEHGAGPPPAASKGLGGRATGQPRADDDGGPEGAAGDGSGPAEGGKELFWTDQALVLADASAAVTADAMRVGTRYFAADGSRAVRVEDGTVQKSPAAADRSMFDLDQSAQFDGPPPSSDGATAGGLFGRLASTARATAEAGLSNARSFESRYDITRKFQESTGNVLNDVFVAVDEVRRPPFARHRNFARAAPLVRTRTPSMHAYPCPHLRPWRHHGVPK
eukprot:SAG22_NODE_473_length_10069_cov_17.183250_10_plen_297_part_00